MRAARLRSPRPGKPGKRLSCLLLLYPISSCRYMPYRTEERDFRTQLAWGRSGFGEPRAYASGKGSLRPACTPRQNIFAFFPVLSAVWHSFFPGLFSVLAFHQHRRMAHCRVSREPTFSISFENRRVFCFQQPERRDLYLFRLLWPSGPDSDCERRNNARCFRIALAFLLNP